MSWNPLYGNGFPYVKPINAAFAQDSVFFAGGTGTGILRSTNSGMDWVVADSGVASKDTVLSIGGDGGNVVAATTAGLFKSRNNGISWTKSDSGLPANIFYGGSVLAGGGGEIALMPLVGSTEGDIFLSTNGGSLWTSINNGFMPNQLVSSAIVFNGKLFIGLVNIYIWGVWYYQLPIITSVKQNITKGIPANFELGQNYPNPFNPSTTISYSIPKSALVIIKVYDILGRQVTTLVNEEKNAGNYNVEFNAGALASGVYFYRMQTGSFIQTKKLLLLK
jgi:hypothetical protein